MSVLLREIKRSNPRAADKLEWLEFCTDSELRTLTRDDLLELFPGEQNFRMRKAIFETVHRQEPVGSVLKEMKDSVPDESLRAALSKKGVLADHLNILKEMKTQMNDMQTILDAQISLLEYVQKPQPETNCNKGGLPVKDNSPDSSSWRNISIFSVSTEKPEHPPEDPPQKPQVDSQASPPASTGGLVASGDSHGFSSQITRRTIKYKMEISGNTLNAHLQILNRLQSYDSSTVSLSLVEGSDTDSKVTLLFCPIASRTGTDVEAAMRRVKGDKRVILILLRHSHEARPVTAMRTWSHFPHVVLHVVVFYHDTVKGLLNCPENAKAISEIRKELLKHSSEISEQPGCAKNEVNTSEPAPAVRRSTLLRQLDMLSRFRNYR